MSRRLFHSVPVASIRGRRAHRLRTTSRLICASAVPALLAVLLAGCGGTSVVANQTNNVFALTPGSTHLDTNCTGCNATEARGAAVHQFTAIMNRGGIADVAWSVDGGDVTAGAGSINTKGQYTPPGYLTADRVHVTVTAALKSDPAVKATSVLTLTPGFLQPLTPENVALGAGGTATVTGILAEAGGSTNIRFALADTASGSGGGLGSLGTPSCQRDDRSFTSCTITYTAPASVPSTAVTYIVATAGDTAARTEATVLLNTAGVSSNPASHQAAFQIPMLLGSSGGNNNDFDANGNRIVDCCGGTLGSLLEDERGRQYLLSNNHVLAKSDHATVGDAVVQPGLIDNNCSPNGAGIQPVGTLSAWLPLSSHATNADAAIAEVASRSVDSAGAVQELGSKLPDGTLAPAPLGTSSTNGKGEAAQLRLRVAKSGRTTGLTCGSVSAIDVDVSVDYYRDCAETRPYLTKTFTHQIGVSGNHLSDAGDSGAILVDTQNAEPVGLYFAGGSDTSGVAQGLANPVGDVLSELDAQAGEQTSYSFVGGADHPVSCLSYGDSTVTAAQSRSLSDAEIDRVQRALNAARLLIDPAAGILGVAPGKSSDHPGEGAVVVYVDEGHAAQVPAEVGGVRTIVVPSNARNVAAGAAPTIVSIADAQPLSTPMLERAAGVKRQVAARLMQNTPAIFGVGIGQSLDNPREAALVLYVDRKQVPANLPSAIQGLRTRVVAMDRFHVTRSYAVPFKSGSRCTLRTHASKQTDLLP